MTRLFVDTPTSLAWEAVLSLIDRPSRVLQEEWGVEHFGSGSPVERQLHVPGKILILRLEESQREITANIKELARVRRLQISADESGWPLLTERGSEPKSTPEVLDDLVSWLKGK